MADYSFEDAAKPYLDWVKRWKAENKNASYLQFVKDLVDHLPIAERYFHLPNGALSATKSFFVLQFPESPVHLTIPRNPTDPKIDASKHGTVHITDETPEGRFRYREYYSFADPELKFVARDSPSLMPIGVSARIGESARERAKAPAWVKQSVPGKKGGKTRHRRIRRRRTVRSK